MHNIEPHFQWREKYQSEKDHLSPFYGREYNEFGYENKVYNYLLHPQWDAFGSETLYLKILYANYDEAFCMQFRSCSSRSWSRWLVNLP